MVTKTDIIDKLKEVNDPELGISIVDMGLVYEVKVKEDKSKKRWYAEIKITFTTPACPMMNYMLEQIKQKLEEIENFDAELIVIFDPPWSPDRMSKEAKIKLGIL